MSIPLTQISINRTLASYFDFFNRIDIKISKFDRIFLCQALAKQRTFSGFISRDFSFKELIFSVVSKLFYSTEYQSKNSENWSNWQNSFVPILLQHCSFFLTWNLTEFFLPGSSEAKNFFRLYFSWLQFQRNDFFCRFKTFLLHHDIVAIQKFVKLVKLAEFFRANFIATLQLFPDLNFICLDTKPLISLKISTQTRSPENP